MKRYEQRLAQKYGPPKKRLAVKDIEAVMVSVAAGDYVLYTDALAAVSQARADALRWVLEQVPDCGIGPDDCCNDCDQSNYYLSIVNEERASLRAIIEQELNQ